MAIRIGFAEMNDMQVNHLDFLQRAANEHGGVAHFKFLWFDVILVNEPSVIRELLIKHAPQLQRDVFIANIFRRFLGNGIFMAEGDAWKKQRKLMQPAFHAIRIQQYADTMVEYTKDMIESWPQNSVIDAGEEFTRLTLRIIAKTMYDVDLVEQTAEIGRLMKELSSIAEAQLEATYVPPTWVPTAQNLRQKQVLRQVRDLLRTIIRERRASGRDCGDLLSMLLLVKDEYGQPMAEEQVIDECMTLFFAGHETTAATLTWIAYLLAEHSDVLDRLKQEIVDTIGGRPMTFEDVKKMPYLEAVVKESLRLYPPAHGFGRSVQEPFEIEGHRFPKGAIVMVNSFVTHRREDLFPDADRFYPDRFLAENAMHDRYAYLPFGAGHRVCLGNMFAMLEACCIVGTLVQSVDLHRASNEAVVMDTQVTLKPRDPLMMRVGKLENSRIAEDSMAR